MLCCLLQDVIRRYKEAHPGNWDLLPERVAFQVCMGPQPRVLPLDSLPACQPCKDSQAERQWQWRLAEACD